MPHLDGCAACGGRRVECDRCGCCYDCCDCPCPDEDDFDADELGLDPEEGY